MNTRQALPLLQSTLLLLAACGGGGSGGSGPDQAIGGAWVGFDAIGGEVFALSTESGQLHWVLPATGEQGFGSGTVNGKKVTFNYTYVAPLGFTLDDGSTYASCTAKGTIRERQSITANTSCVTGRGGSFDNSVTLTYDPLYEVSSSLTTVAGDYDDFGQVVSVGSDGSIFQQDANTGCTMNGQVSIVDPQYNVYRVSFSYANCQGAYAPVNGSRFSGLALYDNTMATHWIIFGVTGVVDGVTYSLVSSMPKM